MNNLLKMTIKNVKNIRNIHFEIPLEKGIYCIAGKNGCGKSTIMASLGRLVVPYSLNFLSYSENSEEASIFYEYGDKKISYRYNELEPNCTLQGLYEGSLFYGTRFKDSSIVNKHLKSGKIKIEKLIDNSYVRENLSKILYGDNEHYKELKKISSRRFAEELRLKNVPYFMNYQSNIVSQYNMSSGECLLISLLDFVNNVMNSENSTNDVLPKMIIIDEVEVALHPSAIKRLFDYLYKIIEENNIVVVLSSHSSEVINRIKPNNMFMIEQYSDNQLVVTNPCYPAYAIRSVYIHDGFDFVILVEDNLAKKFVEKIIKEKKLNDSKLINILPVGGWENVLKMQLELTSNNVLGVHTKIFSILDGDIEGTVKNNIKYCNLEHFFLPIASVEKCLANIISDSKQQCIYKKVNDTFFVVKELKQIYQECEKKDENDKKAFFELVLKDLYKRGISEDEFVKGFSEILVENLNFDSFYKNLEKKLKNTNYKF